jgi:hypothetical protein
MQILTISDSRAKQVTHITLFMKPSMTFTGYGGYGVLIYSYIGGLAMAAGSVNPGQRNSIIIPKHNTRKPSFSDAFRLSTKLHATLILNITILYLIY